MVRVWQVAPEPQATKLPANIDPVAVRGPDRIDSPAPDGLEIAGPGRLGCQRVQPNFADFGLPRTAFDMRGREISIASYQD